jgi:gustatory receptor
MTVKVLQLLFTFGRLYAITPQSLKSGKQKLLVQVYSLVVATVQVAASATSFIHHRRLVLANFKKIKLVMVVATFIFMNSFTICTVLAPTFLKRKQWRKLLQHLQDIERITVNRNTTKMSFLLEFVAVHAIILIPSIYYVYIWNEILSPNFFNQYFVELVQIYFQFFYIYLLCTVVKMLHSGYKYANTLVLKQLNYITLENHVSQKFFHLQMRQIEDIFCFLQEANVEFNDVFGWPIILIILNSAFFFLNYLSEIFRNNFSYGDNLYVEAVVSNMSLASVIMVSCRYLPSIT